MPELTQAEIEQIKIALEYLHDADLRDYGDENIQTLENLMTKLNMSFSSQL